MYARIEWRQAEAHRGEIPLLCHTRHLGGHNASVCFHRNRHRITAHPTKAHIRLDHRRGAAQGATGRLHAFNGHVAREAFRAHTNRKHGDATRAQGDERLVKRAAPVVGAIGDQHHARQRQAVEIVTHILERLREIRPGTIGRERGRTDNRRRVGAKTKATDGESRRERFGQRCGVRKGAP